MSGSFQPNLSGINKIYYSDSWLFLAVATNKNSKSVLCTMLSTGLSSPKIILFSFTWGSAVA